MVPVRLRPWKKQGGRRPQSGVDSAAQWQLQRVLYAIAEIGGIPPVAVGAIDHVSNRQVSKGMKALMPIAIDAITPLLQRAFASFANGTNTFTPEEEAKLATAISQVATALLDGNFTGLIYVIAELGGVPPVSC